MDATHVARALGLPPGTRIGRYTLVRRVATGGMAEVYLAQLRGAEHFAKLVALKRILPQFANDPDFAGMFLVEAKLASRLDHPNVTQVLDFGEYDGEHYITMEFVHGKHLLDLMRAHRGRPLPHDVALTIVSSVARALHHMHELRDHDGSALGLVHRDVSPSNVLLSYEGAIKLTDFGIAKAVDLTSATRTGAFKGKLGYASPEQCRGEPVDRRSDLFALGILLYETTTGARAFSGPNEFAVLGRVARADYVPPQQIEPEYPAALAALVGRAMAADRDERFASAAEFAEAIDGYAHEVGWRLSPARVVEAMTAMFGEPPPVTTRDEVPLLDTATLVVMADQPAPPPRRKFAAAIVGTLVVGGAIAFAMRTTPTADAAAPVITDAAPAAVTEDIPPAPPPVIIATPAIEPVIPAPAATAEPAIASPPTIETPASKPVKRKRTTPARDKPTAKTVPANLYPPGYRP